jgi:hypothetical protein
MRIIITALILAIGTASASEFCFWFNRFGCITLSTTPGSEAVTIIQGNKEGEETIFQSKLTPVGPNKFSTAKQTVFSLEHLTRAVIHDGNRRINSGEWKLEISGGVEAKQIKELIGPAAFGPPDIYFGGEEN